MNSLNRRLALGSALGVAALSLFRSSWAEDDPLRHGHALLIGAWSYMDRNWPRLDDIQLQLEQLRRGLAPHFDDVVMLRNPTVEQLQMRLGDFLKKQGNDPKARLFIYYAGHGFTETSLMRNAHRGFITGTDTPYAGSSDQIAIAKPYAISMDAIRSMVADIDALQVLFIFDSCFAGTIFTARSPAEASSLTAHDITDLMRFPVRQFITAGDINERIPAHSPIPDLLLAALSGDADSYHVGVVTGQQLGLYLLLKTRGRGITPREGKLPESYFSRGEFLFRVAPLTECLTCPNIKITPGIRSNNPGPLDKSPGILDKSRRPLDIESTFKLLG